jgi:DNA repair exonuclease SbcCD ATPase subunit
MVRRVRTKNHNAYYIDGHVYEAFGSEVPSDIVELLNIDSVNLQQQLDRPFLLDTPPGQVAQYLNEVAHLDVIDRALQRLAKWIREIESDIRTYTSNQERLGEAQSSFDYLPDMEQTIEGLEEQEASLRKLRSEHRELGGTIDQALYVNTKLDTIRPLLDLNTLVDVALEHRKAKTDLVKTSRTLFDLLDRIDDVQSQQKKLKPLQKLATTVDSTIQLQSKLSSIQTEAHRLAQLIEQYQRMESHIEKAKEERDALHEQFDEEMGDECILCGRIIGK